MSLLYSDAPEPRVNAPLPTRSVLTDSRIGGMMARVPGGRWPCPRRSAVMVGCAFLAFVPLAVAQPADDAKARTAALNISPGAVMPLDSSDRVGKIRLVIDKSQTRRSEKAFADALIANPDIADVVPLTDKSVYLIGKRIGNTRLTLLDANKRLLGVHEIEVSHDVTELQAELRRSVPGAEFKLGTINGRILLRGLVPDAVALARAVEITEQFTGGCEASSLANNAAGGKPAVVPVDATPGPAPGPAPVPVGKCFVNLLTVRAPQQVLLEVRFVEAVRTAARDLGVTWDGRSNRFRGIAGAEIAGSLWTSASVISGFPSSNIPFGIFLSRILASGTSADVVIEALEQKGLARRLAEPNLVALSGYTASFLAGGEFPFPVPQSGTHGDTAVITVQFKKFGVGLAFTPTVLAEGQINLKIEPEVSDLDPSNSVFLGSGITVPSLVVRRASTTVELRDGQSFAIAGLLQANHSRDLRQLPWIGDVPVLGALFRSASYEKRESDLVIIVTPRLVQPAAPGQKLLTPLDTSVPATERDFFLRGRMEVPKHIPAPYGHILELNGWTAITEVTHAPLK
jgi:pilus assembly protein CpaC